MKISSFYVSGQELGQRLTDITRSYISSDSVYNLIRGFNFDHIAQIGKDFGSWCAKTIINFQAFSIDKADLPSTERLKKIAQPISSLLGPPVLKFLTIHYGSKYLSRFVYEKWMQYLDRPILFSEVKYIEGVDRIRDAGGRYSKYALRSWFKGLAVRNYTYVGLIYLGILAMAFDVHYRKLPGNYYDYKFSKQLFDSFDNLSIVIGSVFAAYNMHRQIYSYSEPFFGDVPIFNESLTKTLSEIVKSALNIKKNDGFFQNMFLYGPPGVGKTMVAKAIAKNLGMNYVMMSVSLTIFAWIS